jgi:hypothetical protein
MGVFSRDIIAPGTRLFSDRITGVSLGTGVSTTYDVECSGSDFLVVQGDLTGAAIGDLAITVQPFEEDGVTLSSVVLTPVAADSPANILNGGHVYAFAKYNVTAIGRVRIFWKNNNAGTQTLTRGSWRATGY